MERKPKEPKDQDEIKLKIKIDYPHWVKKAQREELRKIVHSTIMSNAKEIFRRLDEAKIKEDKDILQKVVEISANMVEEKHERDKSVTH